MWKLTSWGKTRTSVTGVPLRDMTDEEFAAAEALFAPGELRAQGYFGHEAPAPPARGSRRGTARTAITRVGPEPTPEDAAAPAAAVGPVIDDDSAEPEPPAEEERP